MRLLTLVCALSLAASSADAAWAKSNKGGPEVKWSAPSAFVTGQSFKVSLEIVAPEGGTTVANWLVSPAAFTLDGKPLAKREEGGTFNLPAGFKLTGDIDLGPYIKNTANFKLGYANEASDAPPVEVKVLEAAPAGLNFMQMPLEDLSKYQVILRTVRGDITVKFWPDVAPNHVIPGFMIQGGDPTGTGTGSGPRQLQSEFQAQKKHLRGVLSMARSSDPNSASCQFFIMHAAAPSLDNQYSAFGEVVTGMDAVDKIVNTPRGGNDKPKEPQTILEALVVRTQG
jgi:peptidyl-prolyl cis-trans isomerase B (cyclophilin B)